MTAAWIALALALGAAAVVWHRRRLATARRRCTDELEELLARRRPDVGCSVAGPRTLRLEAAGVSLATVDLALLVRSAGGRSADARERLLRSLVDTAATSPRAAAPAWELKRHGLRTLPRLAGEGLAALDLVPEPARYSEPASGLAMIYRVECESPLTYVSDEDLERAGIDERDLHGVALAVLRQRFDAAELRSAVAEGGIARLEPADSCGGSRLLLLPEALPADARWWAAAPTPALLVVSAEHERLDAELAGCGELPEPLPPVVFEVTAGGLRRMD